MCSIITIKGILNLSLDDHIVELIEPFIRKHIITTILLSLGNWAISCIFLFVLINKSLVTLSCSIIFAWF